MKSAEQAVAEGCAFLARYLSGERGFLTADVLAGIGRLRELHRQNPDKVDWKPARQMVRRCCEKLGRKDKDYDWACGE